MKRVQKVILSALLIAATIVLQRFLSIRTPIIAINFSFAPIMLAGLTLGPLGATFVAVVSDLIGALLFPSGSFFWGYTLTALLAGLTAGLCLHRKTGIKIDRGFIIRLILCVVITVALLNGVLNTIWVIITMGGASNVVIPIRILKQCLMLPVEFLTMLALARIFGKQLNQQYFNSPEPDSKDDQIN